MRLAGDALRAPIAERETFLKAACSNDQDLYTEVSEIVEWEERMGGFMRDPLVDLIDLERLDRPFKPGEIVLDRFEIIREVGAGGMGVVYEAYDRKREQRIAIKCAKLGYERLSPELKNALQVRHPNICLVNEIHTAQTDLGELDFLTMEFLDGETLLERLSRGKLENDEALKFARQLCTGLAEAHRSGVLHRDLKPANVILSPGKNKELRAVITDFGLAADQDGNTDLIGGTPSYMAPELKQNGQSSTASDVYALGVILCEMITGQKPFSKTDAGNGDAPTAVAPSKLIKHLPAVWDDAILPTLATRPEKRPSAEQVLAVFDRKSLYRQPWVAITVLAVITAGVALWSPVVAFFKPADTRLVILPVHAPPELAQLSSGIASDVAERVKRLQRKSATISVIPPSDAIANNVTTPEQAAKNLHATHALQINLVQQGTDILVEQDLIEVAHQTQVGNFSDRYSQQTVGDIPSALTGAISSTLHLARPANSDAIAPSATVAYDQGLSYLARDYYSADEAIQSFQQAAEQDPHSPLPWAGLVQAQLAKFESTQDIKWLEQAHQYLQKAEALNRDSVQVLLAAGRLSLLEGKYLVAMDYYSRVQETEPRNIEALLQIAYALDTEGKPEEAIKSYRQVIELDPRLYSSYEYFGSFYFDHGRYQEAENQYKKALEIAPGRPDAYANLGGVLLAEQKFREAVEALQASLKIKENPQSFNNLGAAYAFLKQDDLAAQNYRRATTLQPGMTLYWINLGDSERRLGHSEEAKSSYEKARDLARMKLQANPQHAQALASLAYCRARLGDRSGAQDDAVRALRLWPEDNQVIRYAALTYSALGEWENVLHTIDLGTPKLAEELNVHPDMAEFSKDLRFIQLMDKKRKGG